MIEANWDDMIEAGVTNNIETDTAEGMTLLA
jgi:hypothetical protein